MDEQVDKVVNIFIDNRGNFAMFYYELGVEYPGELVLFGVMKEEGIDVEDAERGYQGESSGVRGVNEL